ncbi:MAG TPA: ribonuclease H, partial [Desulfobacterales bacterium]|nr:ribonuclease H [Desulfobacterales bacterium]
TGPGADIRKSGFAVDTTNNRMELAAVSEALRELARQPTLAGLAVAVTTDSQYVQKGITLWIRAWLANGWRTSGKQPVKNADLWRELWALCQARPVSWHWVMGHAGNPMNEACHHMVEEAIKRRA